MLLSFPFLFQLSHRIVKLAAAIESQRIARALPHGGAYGEPPLAHGEQVNQ